MRLNVVYKKIKFLLTFILIVLLGFIGVIFSVLYVDTFNVGFFKNYNFIVKTICFLLITFLTICSLLFLKSRHDVLFKLSYITIFAVSIVLIILYYLKKTCFLEKFNNIEKFRQFIANFGNRAVILFILIQYLQVVILPIPSFITVGAGVLLFGAFWGSVYSSIGIILGSISSFFVGRLLGIKVVKWLIGERTLAKTLNLIKGKDKVLFTFMFLFPFFPDDLLCFIAGVTTMPTIFFLIMIVIVRLITIFTSSYSINNSLIPFNTWWGVLVWIILFISALIFSIIITKHVGSIQNISSRKKIDKNKRIKI